MDASNNNDAPVTNENSATSEMSTLKLTIETPKDEKDMLIDASSTVKQVPLCVYVTFISLVKTTKHIEE
ncbi:unnamed protein product [Rotaria magnacalcarata]